MRPILSFLTFLTLTSAHAQTAPQEQRSLTLTRNAQSQNVLQAQLSQNIFRQDPYQANYTVQVPYQDTETYYVDVPYDAQEAYQDYETYYTNDYVCHTENHWERRCHNERRCNFAANIGNSKLAIALDANQPMGSDPRCSILHVCGGNMSGPPSWNSNNNNNQGGQPKCSAGQPCDRNGGVPSWNTNDQGGQPKCHGSICDGQGGNNGGDHGGDHGGGGQWPGNGGGDHGGGHGGGDQGGDHGGDHGGGQWPGPNPVPNCHDEQVCENVPVPSQQCGYESTPHQRWVTKYRTVTKYRQEARTRVVTKYRDEQRCCVTKYQSVYDHQLLVSANIQFPQGSELQGAESERIAVSLAGTEAAPTVNVTVQSSVFAYQVVSNTVQAGQAQIVLAMVPRYLAKDLKEKTITEFKTMVGDQQIIYSFKDAALFPRVNSTQQFSIVDTDTQEVIATTEVGAISQVLNQASIGVVLDAAKSYVAVLRVHREGTVLDQAVDFELRAPISFKVDMSVLKDDKQISAQVLGLQDLAQLSFVDQTLPYRSVATAYTVTVARKTDSGKTVSLGAKSYTRAALVKAADGSYTLPLTDIVSIADAKQYVVSGARILVVVEVRRQTQDGQKIQFWKDNWVVVP